MLRRLIVALGCIMPFLLSAQTIVVEDVSSGEAISGVYIFSGNVSVLTNNNGEADISSFGNGDVLVFQHPAYKRFGTTKDSIVNQLNNVVQLEESILKLDEYVVSANRFEQEKREVPTKITTINKREVEFLNPQTSADLLGTSGEVFIQKSQYGGGSPMIRGFAANRVLIVVDGVRMNTAIFRSGNLQNVISVDPNAVENAEVIHGPGTVLYGSDAIGGVMDFHTLSPKFSAKDGWYIEGNYMNRYASASDERTNHLDLSYGNKRWAFVSSATYSQFGDLRMGSVGHDDYTRPEYVETAHGLDSIVRNSDPNVQKNTGYDQLNVMQKIKFKASDRLTLEYSGHYSATSNVPRYDRLIVYDGEDLDKAEWYYGPQTWVMNTLNATYKGDNKLFDEMRVVAAHQYFEESRHDRSYGSSTLRHRTETVNAYSLNIDLDKALADNQHLFYGVEAVVNTVNSRANKENLNTGELNPTSTRYPDGSTWQSYSAYVNYKNNLSEKMTFNAGVRYNHILIDAEFDTTQFPFPFTSTSLSTGAANGNIGVAYRPTDKWQVNAILSSGFRAPNVDDIGKVFDSEQGRVVVPNPDLEAEYLYNAELGVSRYFGSFLKVDVTGFYSILTNAMVRGSYTYNGQDSIMYDGELSEVQALVNEDQVDIYGVQGSVRANLGRYFRLRSHLTYTHGETKEGDAYRHVPPLYGSTHLIFKYKKFMIDAYTEYNGEIAYDDLAPSEQGSPEIYATDDQGRPYSPSWVTMNVKSAYQFSDHFSATLGLENIQDVRYRPYSSGVVAPGRNLVASIRASF